MGIRGYVWTTWSIMSQAAAAFSFKQDPISVLTHLVVQYVSVKHVSLDLHYRTTVSEQIIRTGTKQATNQLKKIQAIFFWIHVWQDSPARVTVCFFPCPSLNMGQI